MFLLLRPRAECEVLRSSYVCLSVRSHVLIRTSCSNVTMYMLHVTWSFSDDRAIRYILPAVHDVMFCITVHMAHGVCIIAVGAVM